MPPTPSPWPDRAFCDELASLAAEAEALEEPTLHTALAGLVGLARLENQERTLARAGAWLSSAALVYQRGHDPTFGILRRFAHAITIRLGVNPAASVAELAMDEVIFALGVECVQHRQARGALESERQDNRTLRAERDGVQAAFDRMENDPPPLPYPCDEGAPTTVPVDAGAADPACLAAQSSLAANAGGVTVNACGTCFVTSCCEAYLAATDKPQATSELSCIAQTGVPCAGVQILPGASEFVACMNVNCGGPCTP